MRVVAVNTASAEICALLIWLQLKILPADTPVHPSEGYWWVAYDGQTPAGFAAMRRSYSFTHTMYLSRAGVLQQYRGNGLQKRLIRVRLSKAKAMGWTHAITDTHNNPTSANSLIGCGFKSYLPQNPWAGDGTAYWIKKL